MSAPQNDNDLLPEQTQGFKVGEKKTMDEINNLGKQPNIAYTWLTSGRQSLWCGFEVTHHTLFCTHCLGIIPFLGKFKDTSKLLSPCQVDLQIPRSPESFQLQTSAFLQRLFDFFSRGSVQVRVLLEGEAR